MNSMETNTKIKNSDYINNSKNICNKYTFLLFDIVTVLIIFSSYIFNFPILVLLSFVISCGVVVFSKYDTSMYHMAFLVSFSQLFYYKGKQLFFLIVILFIIKSLIEDKISIYTILADLIFVLYALVFADYNLPFKFVNIISMVCLFMIPIYLNNIDERNANRLVEIYIIGFLLATFLGYFVSKIPSLAILFDDDVVYMPNGETISRYFGLAYDSNFYALSNYLIVSYFLFVKTKLSKIELVTIIFLGISGFLTFSKSYILIFTLLIVFYIVKNILNVPKMIKFLVFCALVIAFYLIISSLTGIDLLKIILGRFDFNGGMSEITTGRTDIWKIYFEMFNEASIRNLVFGFGYNATYTIAAHNTFIELFFNFGIVGTLMFILYLLHACYILIKNNQRRAYKKNIFFYVPIFVVLAGIFFLSAYTYQSLWINMVIAIVAAKGFSLNGETI